MSAQNNAKGIVAYLIIAFLMTWSFWCIPLLFGLTILLFMGGPNWIFAGYPGILSWIPLGAMCAWIILTGQLTPENRRI
jgi:hypothetical protein